MGMVFLTWKLLALPTIYCYITSCGFSMSYAQGGKK